MKKTILTTLMLAASFAHAAEIKVLETELPARGFRPVVDAKFFMDTQSKQGFVDVTVYSEKYPVRHVYFPNPHNPISSGHGPGHHYPGPTFITLFKDSVKVEGLELVGKKVMFNGPEGAVDCGVLGKSRILRRPTLFLSGKCTLKTKLETDGNAYSVTVSLKTK